MKAIFTIFSAIAAILASPAIIDHASACDCAIRDTIRISIESMEVNGEKVEPTGYNEFEVRVSYESGRMTLFAARKGGTVRPGDSYEGHYVKE